jgi:hypothetical protein
MVFLVLGKTHLLFVTFGNDAISRHFDLGLGLDVEVVLVLLVVLLVIVVLVVLVFLNDPSTVMTEPLLLPLKPCVESYI